MGEVVASGELQSGGGVQTGVEVFALKLPGIDSVRVAGLCVSPEDMSLLYTELDREEQARRLTPDAFTHVIG